MGVTSENTKQKSQYNMQEQAGVGGGGGGWGWEEKRSTRNIHFVMLTYPVVFADQYMRLK